MSPAEIEDELGRRRAIEAREEAIDVWPEHHATWDTWIALGNQWRVVAGLGGAGWLGLEFASIPVALDIAGVRKKKHRRQVMRNLRIMEGHALAVLNGNTETEANERTDHGQ